jgi:hypothetical protein
MEKGKRGPGRPRTRDETESRRYVGFAVPLQLKDDLEAAAKANRRSLSAEATARLEGSFHPLLPAEDLKPAALLLWVRRQGLAALIRYLINVEGDPGEDEMKKRAYQVRHAADNPSPSAAWLPPDESSPQVTFAFAGDNLVEVRAHDVGQENPPRRRAKRAKG